MAIAGSAPTDMSPTCKEPPLPRQQPVSFPNSSAIKASALDALCQSLAVPAMRQGDDIIRFQRQASTDDARFPGPSDR